MDGNRFDDLTRSLARNRSRRSVLRGLVAGGMTLAVGRAGSSLAARPSQVPVCHWDATTSTYTLLSVPSTAVSGHQKHGDKISPDFASDPTACGDCNTSCSAVDPCTPAACNGGVCNTATKCAEGEVCRDARCAPIASECPDGTVEQNGGCFVPCENDGQICGDGCSSCRCDPSTDDPTLLCRDYLQTRGICYTNADCPPGSACDLNIVDRNNNDLHLCNIPCLTCDG